MTGLIVTTHHDPATLRHHLKINHADPVVEITEELLEQIRMGLSPFATFDDSTGALTITDDNREVIYRVEHFDAARGIYRAVWPD